MSGTFVTKFALSKISNKNVHTLYNEVRNISNQADV